MICLTFDVEEFDTPEEYGHSMSFEEKISTSTTGLNRVMEIIDINEIRCTFFTTATYAQTEPKLIKRISEQHEIASHTFYHSSFKNEDLLSSKLALEEITGKQVNGFRMPRLAPVSNLEILKAGYTYNSSLNPTWIPGRYNNLKKPRTSFYEEGLLQIPTSVTPIFRIPLFWLSFKNFPMWWLKKMMLKTLKHDGCLSLYFHPWEFIDTTNYGLPKFMTKISGEAMLKRLEETIHLLKNEGEFITMNELASNYSKENKH
ncbi:MAG: polysaccharide deacetylase family protein [Bacteroidota bacterium]